MYNQPSDIINSYRKDNLPYFLVLCGKQILERHEENDLEDGAEKLEHALKKCGGQKVVVNIYKTIGKTGITDKTEIYKSYPFQNQYTLEEKNEYYNRSGIGAAMISEIRDVKRDLLDIKAKIEIEAAEDDEDIEEQMQPNNQGVLGAILGNPAVQSFLTNFLTNITANVVSRPMNRPQPVVLSGDDHAAIVQSCIDSLFGKGMTVGDLQKLAAMEPTQISFLLNMLRNQ